MLTGFSHFQPIDGVPAVDSTEVRVWYSPGAIHFGVRAREPHGEVHATLADRDRIFADDYVQLLLGTFNDGRQAFMFAVNPLGVQADGALVERGVTAGGGFLSGGGSAREAAGFESRLRVRVQGPAGRGRVRGGDPDSVQEPPLSVEGRAGMAAPCAAHDPALRLRGLLGACRAGQRVVPAAGRDASPGCAGLERGLALDVTPEVTARLRWPARCRGGWDYSRAGPELGGTARWGISNNLTPQRRRPIPISRRWSPTCRRSSSIRATRSSSPRSGPSSWTGSSCSRRRTTWSTPGGSCSRWRR